MGRFFSFLDMGDIFHPPSEDRSEQDQIPIYLGGYILQYISDGEW